MSNRRNQNHGEFFLLNRPMLCFVRNIKLLVEIRVVSFIVISLRCLKIKNILVKLVPFFFCRKRIYNWKKKKGHTICFPHLFVLFVRFETIRLCFYKYQLYIASGVLDESVPFEFKFFLLQVEWVSRGFSRKYHGMYYYNFEKQSKRYLFNS